MPRLSIAPGAFWCCHLWTVSDTTVSAPDGTTTRAHSSQSSPIFQPLPVRLSTPQLPFGTNVSVLDRGHVYSISMPRVVCHTAVGGPASLVQRGRLALVRRLPGSGPFLLVPGAASQWEGGCGGRRSAVSRSIVIQIGCGGLLIRLRTTPQSCGST